MRQEQRSQESVAKFVVHTEDLSLNLKLNISLAPLTPELKSDPAINKTTVKLFLHKAFIDTLALLNIIEKDIR